MATVEKRSNEEKNKSDVMSFCPTSLQLPCQNRNFPSSEQHSVRGQIIANVFVTSCVAIIPEDPVGKVTWDYMKNAESRQLSLSLKQERQQV